ncbi:hypothetical protein RI129_011231 [Pyrocoelia pectoralis]|uniref:Uncharacterized protein n=1 Tax=Pyrocoelia pectoralis TaxID=417401 RepID=A0AAN7V0N3_9COLE
MELKYIIMTIIKILISVPCILMVQNAKVMAASLVGGYFNNNDSSSFPSEAPITSTYPREKQMQFDDNPDYVSNEEIPDPSALILPGYNLPDNIFNKGKPFYLEKDPVTGKVDFGSKTSLSNVEEEEFDYIDEEPSSDMYAKSNINRKDGSISSHKQSDVNQLTPNFHDFLNLPVKYNPEKYVYPLISSSYANTKIQGNINKYHNHKNDIVTTYKPTYYTIKTPYFNPNELDSDKKSSATTPSLQNRFSSTIVTTAQPDYNEDISLTTQNVNDVYLTTVKYSAPTTTKRILSIFEQLFGEYDEITTEDGRKSSPPIENLLQTKDKQEPSTTEVHNILTGSEMGHEAAYEYEDDYGTIPTEKQNNTAIFQTKPLKFEIQKTSTTLNPTTTLTTTTKKVQPIQEYDYEFETTQAPTTTSTEKTMLVTSMQLGEKHFSTANSRPPIIAVTQNLKEQLNKEKIPKPFSYKPIPNTNSIRILPNQNTVSFVVGNHQHVGGDYEQQYQGSPYDSNPFRPLVVEPEGDKDTVSYIVQTKPVFSQSFAEALSPKNQEIGGSSINIQPIKTSEASLSIGVPVNTNLKIPGQVVDENLGNEKIEFPKTGTGAKIIFPDQVEEKISTITPNLLPPPLPTQSTNQDILHLNSKPMYHQLPSDLTPPNEQDEPPHADRRRPPWDPRPGHFHNGKPEYLRPPRPQLKPTGGEIYKRIDKLPNILPQFRPNAKLSSGPHYFDNMKNGYMRQPLLERPSNRPVLFFEKLMPPPPAKNLHNLRKVPMLEEELRNRNGEVKRRDQYVFHQIQTPPPSIISNRRSGELTIETLQMIQAKQLEKESKKTTTTLKTLDTDKPLYVVYPVNSAPIKLDALDTNKKETVVIGTRAELPLPPSKIKQEFAYESPQDRNDAPILKPHLKPNYPMKTNFPYPLERPEASLTTVIGNNLEETDVEARIVNSKINYKNPNQISVTLKTYTERPIAIAYTPTEPYRKLENTEKYSMPNYASPVISEIRPTYSNDRKDSEITVSTIMHAGPNYHIPQFSVKKYVVENHKSADKEDMPTKLDFEAPFQASANIDGMTQGWTVIRKTDKSKIDRSDQNDETTTIAIAATSEFDIENFKPELFGGFKPIYHFSDGVKSNDSLSVSEERAR